MIKNERGFGLVGILVVLVVIAVVAGAGLFVINSQEDSESNNNEATQSSEGSETTATESASPKDITKSYELSSVCEGASLPGNVISSDTGKRIAQFTEKDQVDGEYNNSGSVYLPKEYRVGDNELAVDYVSCLNRTDNTSSTETCEFNQGKTAKMNVNDYELTMYRTSDGSKVVDAKIVAATKECPTVATIRDGEFSADVDETKFEEIVKSVL